MNRTAALLIVSMALALPAVAGTDDVCWDRDLERMDFYTNPPSRGDNNFFSFTVSGTANVTMIYPNTLSMRQLPISLYELRTSGGPTVLASGTTGTIGCSNTVLNNLDYFMPDTAEPPAADASCLGKYNPALQYPEPESAYSGGSGSTYGFESGAGSSVCSAISYTSANTNQTGGLAWEFTLWPADGTSGTKQGSHGSIDDTCTAAVGASSGTAYQDCQICVKTKGYWFNYAKQFYDTTPTTFVAKGNWLNFFPPKWSILHLGYKRLVNGPLLNPLREGIGTQNGSTGWLRLQKMLPQSCSGQGRPNQRISSVDGLTYSNTSNPLAEMLFNVAWTVSSEGSTPPSSWGFFNESSAHPSSEAGANSDAGKKAGFCPGCNAGFSVMFSDGRGIDGWPNCDSANYLLGTFNLVAPGYCKNAMVATAGGSSDGTIHDSNASCSATTVTAGKYPGLGTEGDGDDYLKPSIGSDVAQLTQTGGTYYGQNGAACSNDWLGNVAGWMFATDLASNSTLAANDIPGTNLRLYTVGIGDNYFGELNTLQAAASAGHGLFLSASNFATLEQNITKVFLDILSNSTSFSVAAITTVQTRGTTFAFIPRFRPLGGAQWEGRLFRFRLFNEFAAGCGPTELTGGPDGGPLKDALNPNGNGSCTDVYLTDKNGGYVGEDDGGTFVLLDTSQPFNNGWPILSPKTPAVPVWEAASLLTSRELTVLGGGGTARNILTVPLDGGIPSAGSSLITYNDFSTTGVATITDYMKLSGVNSDFCVGMSSTSRHTYASEQDCGKDLMKFIDGQDVLHQNTDGGLARPNILGDIFHSSPILVTPPVNPGFCDLGIINQCVPTLYRTNGATGATPLGQSAYNTYVHTNGNRQEILLVGANDGMLHAFQAGTETTAATFDTSNNETQPALYDDGTGAEVWAFIPPDMLPKLQRYALSQSHNILVDGAPWVRDIWEDGSGTVSGPADRQKQADEFHTIAIIGEREGGRHYTALDITDTSNNPKYLWTWPPPGSLYELAEGESWNDTTPAAPPVGPILMADSSGPITVTVGGTAVNASEQWVVAISGGYDPNLIRGRAIYILDAWNGTLLYKFSRYDLSSGATCSGASPSDVRCLLAPVVAPVGLLQTNPTRLFFDLAVVGDTDGNIWTIDMLNPGATSGTPALVNNWFGGLTFTQFKGGAVSQKEPFFALAGSQLFPPLDPNNGGDVRVFIGAGDRDQIKIRDTDSADGGTCNLDNLRGCLRNNCTVDVSQTIDHIGASPTEGLTAEWKFAASGTNYTTNTFAFDGGDNTTGACNDPLWVRIKYSALCDGVATCSSCTSGSCACIADPNDGGTLHNNLTCDFDGGNDGGEECPDTAGKQTDAPGAEFNSPAITNTRFYAVRLFDPPNYTHHPRMISAGTQTTYNSNTLTDTNLTDVTDGGVMGADGGGWMVRHMNDQNEKAVGAAFLLGGCVAWNTEVPSVLFSGVAADGGQVCKGGTIPSDTAYLYQADSNTGAVQCGLAGSATQLATVRFQQRQVTVTPQALTPVVSLNTTTGQAAYSGISLEPGGRQPLTLQTGAQGVVGDVSWLDVSRNLHNCRHVSPLADGGTQCR